MNSMPLLMILDIQLAHSKSKTGKGSYFAFRSLSLSLSLSELYQRAPDQQSQLLKDSGVLC